MVVIKIGAGFYSNNLVKYLVRVLKMDLSNIEYKLITHKVLKPYAFKSFVEYILDNFDQKEAKLLANSFIGNLHTKYNKINHGFTCKDYETTMKMNITIIYI